MSYPDRYKGIALISAVILMIFISITALSTTILLIGRLKQTQLDQKAQRCIYTAQAGIAYAGHWYRYRDSSGRGYFSLGRVDLDSENFFILGATAADMLMVNTTDAYLDMTGRPSQRGLRLEGLCLKNATNSKNIYLDRMIVSWNTFARLRQITIADKTRWAGNKRSPADCNLSPNINLSSAVIYAVNQLRFDSNMSGSAVTATFIMTDGSSKVIDIFPASAMNCFTLKSSGKIPGQPLYRTVEAEYNAAGGRIIRFREIDSEVAQ